MGNIIRGIRSFFVSVYVGNNILIQKKDLSMPDILKQILPKKRLQDDQIGFLFFFIALILGGWYRINAAYMAGFPIVDGGLFYTMTQTLQENAYHLPLYVHYNSLDIPFAYPPLGFYLSGFLSNLLNIELIEIFQYFPATVLTLIIIAFYSFANLFLKSRLKAGVATFIYVHIPSATTWLIMGGGITRSLGQLFLILAIQQIWLLFTQYSKKHLILTIIFSSLVSLSHPEAMVHTVGLAILIFLFKKQKLENLKKAFWVTIGTVFITSPWWITILSRFGTRPFLSASKTSFHSFVVFLQLGVYPISGELFTTIIIALAIIGIAVNIAQKHYFLPIMYILPFILDPRSGFNITILAMALHASIALCDFIFPALAKIESRARGTSFNTILQSRSEKFLFANMILIIFISMQTYSSQISQDRVSEENLQAYKWVERNTPSNSRFLVITGSSNVLADPTLEWFPTLAYRQSLTTIQGREWIDGEGFDNLYAGVQLLQNCITECIKRGKPNTLNGVSRTG